MKKINNIRKNILIVCMVASMSISLLGAAKVGLSNLGNTCYMNATLQVLMNSQPLNDVVAEANAQGAPLADTVENHYRALVNATKSEDRLASLRAFYQKACEDSQPYDLETNGLMPEAWAAMSLIPVPGRQQDAQEYLGNFFRILGPQYYNKFITKFQKQLKCLHCNGIRQAIQVELSSILSLAIEGKTNVTECVHGFFSSAVDDTPSQYCVQCLPHGDADIPALAKVEIRASRTGLCTQCNILLQTEAATQCTGCHRTKTTGQFKIKTCPMLLALQLKRFDAQGHKLLTPISIQQKLDLGDYVKEGIEGCTEYELYAIVVHGGATLGGGHYWSYVKNYDTGEWLHYNDRRVNNVSPVQMKNIAESGIDNSHLPGNGGFDLNNNATPYLLFYQRDDYAVSQHIHKMHKTITQRLAVSLPAFWREIPIAETIELVPENVALAASNINDPRLVEKLDAFVPQIYDRNARDLPAIFGALAEREHILQQLKNLLSKKIGEIMLFFHVAGVTIDNCPFVVTYHAFDANPLAPNPAPVSLMELCARDVSIKFLHLENCMVYHRLNATGRIVPLTGLPDLMHYPVTRIFLINKQRATDRSVLTPYKPNSAYVSRVSQSNAELYQGLITGEKAHKRSKDVGVGKIPQAFSNLRRQLIPNPLLQELMDGYLRLIHDNNVFELLTAESPYEKALSKSTMPPPEED